MTNAISFKVEYDTKVFDLTVPKNAFDFIFELYNFLFAAKVDKGSGATRNSGAGQSSGNALFSNDGQDNGLST
jgi:hypothetical protein